MIKTNIKMRVTPEQSAKVQEICFKNGIDWTGREKIIKYVDKRYLFILNNKSISYDSCEDVFNEDKFEEIDPELFIKTNGSCIKNKEFKYPMWFKSKKCCLVVRFDSLKSGKICIGDNMYRSSGTYRKCWNPHTNTEIWEQVENPNLATDKEIEQVINEEYKKDNSINKDKQDMINPSHYKKGGIEAIDYMKAKSTPEEFKGHLRLTALKYLSRYGQKDNELQELEKAKWYLDRLIQELKNEN